jgi:hypothetical protein
VRNELINDPVCENLIENIEIDIDRDNYQGLREGFRLTM